MIYRVGDGDNPAYDYSSQLKPAKNTEGQEKFSLEHQNEQTSSQKKADKGDDKKLHEKPDVTVKKQGVRLELSGSRPKADWEKETASGEKTETAGIGLFGSFYGILQDFLQVVKNFFYKIWNDPPQEPVSSEVTLEEAERYTEEYYAMKGMAPPEPVGEIQIPEKRKSYEEIQAEQDEKIRKSLRSGNLDQVINLLTDDGRRTIAKNSTLLTYYDRSGKITQINASDRERILHGDRNVRKL
ncbi:MAG TPA: hypothetical protein DCR27_05950 [Lachnospiraceae bacterium]|nr:hypothetical protein [Lachnospiraceae bacterium]